MDLEQIVVFKSDHYFNEEHSLSWLIDKLTGVIETIDHVISYNKQIIAEVSGGGDISAAKIFHTTVNRNNYDVWHVPYYTMSDPCINKALEAQRTECQSVIDMINNGHMPYNVKFLLNSPWPRYAAGFQGPATYAWVACHISEQAICPLCKETYTKMGMSMHTGSMACMRDQQQLDVKAEGYQIVDAVGVRAIIKAGIEYKVRPSGMEMWVPGWVNDAIKTYYSKEGGFAGMKLNEYLSKIKGD